MEILDFDTDLFGLNTRNDADLPGSDDHIAPVVVAQGEDDLVPLMMAAVLLRGDIRVVHSTKFDVGYEIKPIMWFSKKTDDVLFTLDRIGLSYRGIYSRTEDITKLCHAFHRFFSLSRREKQLKMVRHFNGILPQPIEQDEVHEVLDMIDNYVEQG
tara:strand:- start:466 stop:933 length:468 start_codon:yes stop_codon:yes gene_type:complete